MEISLKALCNFVNVTVACFMCYVFLFRTTIQTVRKASALSSFANPGKDLHNGDVP